jgi:hypothetical protein
MTANASHRSSTTPHCRLPPYGKAQRQYYIHTINTMNDSKSNNGLETGIEHPHDHDVLSGRGNFVNYHAGNEHFRALVRKYKIAYVACPKPQKGMFSRMIVDEICNRTPPGRFLKQDNATKMWCEIGDKKALDKTRQALREGAPEILKEIDPEDEDEGEVSQGMHSMHQVRRIYFLLISLSVLQPKNSGACSLFASLGHYSHSNNAKAPLSKVV